MSASNAATTATQTGMTLPGGPAGEKWEILGPLVVEKLANGMTFLIYPNQRAPIFSGVIRFDVGGKNEHTGTTGIAHMFEHMAFKGTRTIGTRDWPAEKIALAKVEDAAYAFDGARERLLRERADAEVTEQTLGPLRRAFAQAQAAAEQYVVKDEFDQIYSREGATDMNAMTSQDATTYFVSLPANRLELWAKMESERLTDPVMREFYSERDVVMEERRMRNDNNPFGRLWELLMATAYTASPYGYPTIGFESDIRNLKATEAYEFFRENYTPDRGIGVLVGDIDVPAARRLLRETFGTLPARPDGREDRHIIAEPPQEGERRVLLRLSATPTLLLAWHKPAAPDPADARAEVLAQVLTGGRSARWFEKFVKKERLASDVSAFTAPGDLLDNMFAVYATPQDGVPLDRLEKALRAEVDRLRSQPVGAEELERARKNLRADTIRALESNLGFAQRLAEATLIGRDSYYLEKRLRQLQAVTADEIEDFARRYLVDDNLTVAAMEPPAPAAPAPAPKPADGATTAAPATGGTNE
ncbi:MAG: insulinase family protein [bacterium]|nr:insulinase family protein [bacterium]